MCASRGGASRGRTGLVRNRALTPDHTVPGVDSCDIANARTMLLFVSFTCLGHSFHSTCPRPICQSHHTSTPIPSRLHLTPSATTMSPIVSTACLSSSPGPLDRQPRALDHKMRPEPDALPFCSPSVHLLAVLYLQSPGPPHFSQHTTPSPTKPPSPGARQHSSTMWGHRWLYAYK
jgi:hypothetical protein